jgi:hypothetical protein
MKKRSLVPDTEGGGVKVDGGGATMTKSGAWTAWGRGWRRHALGPGMRRRLALGLVSRMTSGGSGAMVSMVIEEWERVWGQKNAICGKREHGAWNFSVREVMRDAPLVSMSPFPKYWLMRTSIFRLQLFLPLRYLALSHDHEHNN